jgi:hypothetical protein
MKIFNKYYFNLRGLFIVFTLLYILNCLNLLFFDKFKQVIYLLELLPIILLFVYPTRKFNKIRILPLFFLYSLFLLIQGFLSDNWINYIFTDFLTVLSFFYCYTFYDPEKVEEDFLKFVNLTSYWLILGLPLAWFFIFKFGLQPSIEIGTRAVFTGKIEVSGPDNFIKAPIEFSVFLMVFLPYIKNRLKVVVVLSFITYFIFGIFTATRTPILLFFLSTFSALILNWNFVKRKIFILISVLAIVSTILIFDYFTFGNVKMAITNSFIRLTGEELLSSRSDENKQYLNSLTPKELWLGKGLGGSNTTGMWEKTPHGIAMIHRGDINLIMKGGIILLTIIILILLYTFINLYRNKILGKHLIFVLVCYLLYESGHTLWGNFTMQLFLILTISFAGRNIWNEIDYNP